MGTGMVQASVNAVDIPPLNHKEAGKLARVELERFIALLETLAEEDWLEPTYCTAWNVQQMVCHQAGAYAGSASFAEFRRQWGPPPQPKAGQMTVDAVNDRQVADRATATPAELIAELRRVGPKAIATRQKIPAFIRGLRLDYASFLYGRQAFEILRGLRRPYGPSGVRTINRGETWLGLMRLDYITDLIYTRDTWMHRMDICLATGREMILTGDHDGRMMALVMRDLATQLEHALCRDTVAYHIPGPAGGTWNLGPGATPVTTIEMSLLFFNVLASARITADEARARGLVSICGDVEVANRALDHMSPLSY